jgi:squalene-hopene/tetraprenyl-beta-curcumene cyclase
LKSPAALAFVAASFASIVLGPEASTAQSTSDWDPRAAAAYLDGRLDWWLTWPNAARDQGTACVSCHTALPYLLARPTLRRALAESSRPEAERLMLASVTKRVRLWRDVEPFYPDQTRGLPKTSESRGTEAVLNALILATRDAEAGAVSEEGRAAFENLWALQMKVGALTGGWPWLNFGLEPWEAAASPYFGASLAAIAVGTVPQGYAASPEIHSQVALLRDYLHAGAETESLFNRLMALWASSVLPGLLEDRQRASIIDAAIAAQGADGGWSMGALGPWQPADGRPGHSASDGYATAVVVLALRQAGLSPLTPALRNGRAWLVANQSETTGAWPASSLNTVRAPTSDRGKFMSDAATAYAVLALVGDG